MENNKRLLSFHLPNIKGHPKLPLNYQFLTHYSTTIVDEEGVSVPISETFSPIYMSNLHTELSEFCGYYKPISRIFEDKK